MLTATLLLAYSVDRVLPPFPATGDWCGSIYTVALATAEAQASGIPRTTVDQAAQQLPTPEARQAAAAIVQLAYTANRDERLSPPAFAELVKDACLHPER